MIIQTINATDPPTTPPTFVQDPSAIRAYQIEWAAILVPASDLPLTRVWSAVGSSGSLTVVDGGLDATRAVVTLSGGTAGVTYRVTCRLTTAFGDREERSFYVRIQDT